MPLTQGLVYFIQKDTPLGWTESWYGNSGTTAMISALQSIQPARLNFLSIDNAIVARRAAIVGGTKDFILQRLTTPASGALNDHNNEPGDCILYKARASGRVRNCPFRGVVDDWIADDMLTSSGVAGLASIDSYMNQVIGQQLGLRLPDTAQIKQPVISITSPTLHTNLIVTVGVAVPGVVSGDLVRIRGCKDMPLVNGLWRVGAITTGLVTTYELVGSSKYGAFQVGGATIQKVIQGFGQITGYGFGKVSFRKTGRPFGLERGRIGSRILHH